MLRASWALISLPLFSGARSRFDRPIPAFFSPNLWRQDRFFTFSPKSFILKNPTSTETATPEVALDNETGVPEAATDAFTPSTEMPSSFRFPPFPLAVVEEANPRISAESEPETDADIFEPASAEYRAPAYDRIPQPSADILTQVARSLPELLPEPESDPASIFEDKSHVDYAGIAVSSSVPITSTQSLEMLVAGANYDQALRVLDELLEVGTVIPLSFSYEVAALAVVKSPVETKAEMDDQVAKFRKWFSLIPRADQSRPRTFRTIRDRITLSPVNSLRLLVEFGLIAAEKGFARGTHYRVTSAVSMYGDPDVVIQFINELRRRNRIYLEGSSRSTDVDTLDRRFHVDVVGVAVRALASAGRFDHAVQLIPDPTETDFHLTPYTYNFLVSKLQATEDPRYLPHINFVAQHKSETRFRSIGLKKMDKGMLALAVRCLANASQFDLAMALLPNLEGVEVAVMGQTLDVLLARLQDTRDARYSPYIDHVSKLRPSTELIPASTALSNTTEPPESESAGSATDITRDQPELIPASTALSTTTETPAGSAIDVEKDQYGPAVEALTKAWCLDEALSLVPDYHRTNDRHTTRIYNLLLWKLKASCNPKYQSAMQRITQLSDSTKELARQAKARRQVMEDANEAIRAQREAEANGRQAAGEAEASRKHAARRLEDFEGEDIHLSSSISSKQPQHVGSNLAAALRALKKGFRSLSNSHKPHPLTVVRFMELYLASGRTRAIPLLRNFVLKRTVGSWSYVFAEMLFHSRNRNPDLVIQTFVTHFYIVGLPRDELIIRLGVLERLPRAKPDIWSTRPHMRLYPEPVHTAVVWRALLAVTTDERALEDLYSKLLKFASRSMMESALHPGVPLLQPPPSWKTGVDASAFTPFIRRICTAFGTDRGARILSDMLGVGIKPTIYQLTELAMEYSRTGHELKALMVLDQVERTLEKVDSVDGEAAGRRTHLTPRVDQVFYTAVIRGFLMSNKVATAREVERRMFKRYGYVAGKNQYLDELYKDLRTAESGNRVPGRPPPTSVVHTSTYKALLENPQGRLILDPPSETSNSAGA